MEPGGAAAREAGAPSCVRLDAVIAEQDGRRECRIAMIDVTEQRLAEAALQEREARLRAILDTVPDGILTLDEQGVIVALNPAAARIFDYEPEALIGQRAEVLVPTPDRAGLRQRFTAALRGDERPLAVANLEPLGQRRDGSVFPMEAGGSEVRQARDGEGRRFVCVVRDISGRRRREQELRHAQRMEAVGALASGMAHDFNNLLMAIGGTANVALRALAPDHPAHPRVRQIADAVAGGASLARRLLNFGSARRSPLEPVAIDDVVTGASELLRRLIGEHVRLTVRPDAAGAWVLADPGEIEQVLLNLSANARDAMAQGGELTIETVRRTAGQPAALGVAILVSDTGSGMDEATRAHIFEPFFSNKRIGGGTGLGLATVLDIVHRLGGHVSVDSAVGRGSTFTLWFPETAQRPSAAPARPQHGDETVLLVEDDPLVRAAVDHYLGALGYRTLVAASPEEALALCQQRLDQAHEKIDVVLTDVLMPGRLGGDLAKEMQATWPGLRVLFMSAQPGEELVRLGRLPPEAPLLAKPFDERALGLALRRVLNGKENARRRVLLVEDNEDILESLCTLLEAEGYQVLTARDGYEGLEVALREHPEAVLSDLGLPRLSGLDMARRLRPALPEARLVALSGRAEAVDRDAARQAGFDAYLVKPADVGQLLQALG